MAGKYAVFIQKSEPNILIKRDFGNLASVDHAIGNLQRIYKILTSYNLNIHVGSGIMPEL
jgi:hypothetical protein